jgi:hypothetical protein
VIPPISAASSARSSIAQMEINDVVVEETAEKIPPHKDPESPFSFIYFIESHPNTKEFIYMIPAEVGKSSTIFNPYNLRIVNFSEINTKSARGFFTMSSEVCLSN